MKLKTPTFPRKGHHDSDVVAAAPVPAPPAPVQYAAPVAAPAAAPPLAPTAALKKAAGGLAQPVRQRNTAAMIAGLAFILIAGAIGASVASSFDDSIDVLVADGPIAEGQPVTEDDFRVVQVAAGAGDIQVMSPESLEDLAGRIAAGPIGDGSLIHPDQFAAPFSDQQIVVGAALEPDQFPAGGLKVGDQVRLIALASRFSDGEGDEFHSGQEIAVGQISNVAPLNGNSVHFSIRVPESATNVIAQLVALDRISLGLLDDSVEVDTVSPLPPAAVQQPETLETGAGE